MSDKPLTEDHVANLTGWLVIGKLKTIPYNPALVKYDDVQSAKRLLKQTLHTLWPEKNASIHSIVDGVVDACFQIDDDNQEAAKGGKDSLNGCHHSESLDKPPRKSLKKYYWAEKNENIKIAKRR
jgi:hypothetical protein